MELRAPKILPDEPAADQIVADRIRRYAHGKGQIEILEAGCGRRWPYRLHDVRYVLTGVDVNEDALRIRQEEKKDLDHVILGDLRTVRLEEHHFDIVYSAFVLEHIAEAELVFANFLRWLKPGGLMILKFPDRDSVYGFVTRITPYWLHVLYKRYLVGNPNAGKPGFGPFPTVHEEIISRRAFLATIRRHQLTIKEEYGFGTLPTWQRLGTRVLAGLSLGRLVADYCNLLYILEAAPVPQTRAVHLEKVAP